MKMRSYGPWVSSASPSRTVRVRAFRSIPVTLPSDRRATRPPACQRGKNRLAVVKGAPLKHPTRHSPHHTQALGASGRVSSAIRFHPCARAPFTLAFIAAIRRAIAG